MRGNTTTLFILLRLRGHQLVLKFHGGHQCQKAFISSRFVTPRSGAEAADESVVSVVSTGMAQATSRLKPPADQRQPAAGLPITSGGHSACPLTANYAMQESEAPCSSDSEDCHAEPQDRGRVYKDVMISGDEVSRGGTSPYRKAPFEAIPFIARE